MSLNARKPLQRISEQVEMEDKENAVRDDAEIQAVEKMEKSVLRRSGNRKSDDNGESNNADDHLSNLLAKMEENYRNSVDRLNSELEEVTRNLKKTNESLQMERYRNRNQKKEIEKRAEKENQLVEKHRELQEELKKAKINEEGAMCKEEMKMLETNCSLKLEKMSKELNNVRTRMKEREDEISEEMGFMQEQLKQYEREKSVVMQSSSKQIGGRDEYLDNLQQKLGSLTATKEHLLNQIEEREAKIVELESELLDSQMRITQVECELDSAQQAMVEAEGNNSRTNRYLLEEQEKIKSKRAEYLSELVRLRRDHEVLSKAHENCANVKKDEFVVMTEKVAKLEEEIARLEEAIKAAERLQDDFEKLKKEKEENFNSLEEERRKVTEISNELLKEKAKNDALKKALKTLDQQNDSLVELKKRAELATAKIDEKCKELEQKLTDAKTELENFTEMQTTSKQLREDNDRLVEKVAYLTEELSSTHTDYREELANLAKQICVKSEKSSNEIDGLTSKISKLEADKRQGESTLRSTQRQLDQAKLELRAVDKRTQELREEQMATMNENAKLKSGMVEALAKIEKYKERAETQKALNSTMDEKITAAFERSADLENQLMSLNECVEQKDNLIAYLRSQIEVKQTQKMKPSSSHSTLVSVVSDDSYNLETEIESCRELEDERDQLQISLERRKDALDRMKRGVGRGVQEETSLLKTAYDPMSASSLNSEGTNELGSNFSLSSRGVGTMRHDIPHRFSSYLVWKGAKCAVCLEGVSLVRYAFKCVECNIIVHRSCAANVVNTCGLPLKCADFYLESHTSASSTNLMSGWVKVFRSNDDSGRWRSFWASVDDHSLRFYENDKTASGQSQNPQISIDMESDSWRIQSGNVPSNAPLEGADSRSLLIEIQLASYRLYMLAPTVQSKQRWIQTLQTATNRRMFVRRRSSACINEGSSMLLPLDRPHNLTINCTQVVDDWLLIGAQEGLFVCSVSNPRVPFNVGGLFAVYHIELIASIQTLLIITGSSRHLFALHVRNLRSSLESRHPSVQMTPVGNISNCHLMMVDKQKLPRFICVATPEHIHVLNYNSRLDMFTPSHMIATIDPCMSFLSLPNGFIFAADSFYVVDMQTLRPEPVVIAGCENDLPIAAVSICEKELLLAYSNTGVFVDLKGNKTRKENFYWSRAPMEFIYTAPFLYAVYTESLEILKIVEYTGSDSKTMEEDPEVYKCKNAHFTGFGIRKNDVMFVLSSEERVELHVFNNALPGLRKGSFKQRRQDTKAMNDRKHRF